MLLGSFGGSVDGPGINGRRKRALRLSTVAFLNFFQHRLGSLFMRIMAVTWSERWARRSFSNCGCMVGE